MIPTHPHAQHPVANFLPRAVIAVLHHPDNLRVLGVSRGKGSNKWGLIGGKVDPEDESLEAAIFREAKEESGLTLLNIRPVPFADCSTGEDGKMFLTHAFYADYEGDLISSSEGDVAWVDWGKLLRGPFAEYHMKLLTRMVASPLAA